MSRAGKKAFDQCRVRAVDFTRFMEDKKTGVAFPETELPLERVWTLNGYRAALRCPQTEDQGVSIESPRRNHPTQAKAFKFVRDLAGQLICEGCPYSSMDAVEVSAKRKELAEAEAARIEAYRHWHQALAELQQPPQLPQPLQPPE